MSSGDRRTNIDVCLLVSPRIPSLDHAAICLSIPRAAAAASPNFNSLLAVSGSTPPRRKYIEALLKRGIERVPVAPQQDPPSLGLHENIRGGGYYDKEKQHAH